MLPAPRHPLAPEAVPDPPPLSTVLTGLLRSTGAQAVRAVRSGSGALLAQAGLADGDDVPALVELARGADAMGRARGEWLEDLVVTLGRTVHVLRASGDAVLHVRLDPDRGDVAVVRRGLAGAEVQRALEAAVSTARDAGSGADTGTIDGAGVGSARSTALPRFGTAPAGGAPARLPRLVPAPVTTAAVDAATRDEHLAPEMPEVRANGPAAAVAARDTPPGAGAGALQADGAEGASSAGRPGSPRTDAADRSGGAAGASAPVDPSPQGDPHDPGGPGGAAEPAGNGTTPAVAHPADPRPATADRGGDPVGGRPTGEVHGDPGAGGAGPAAPGEQPAGRPSAPRSRAEVSADTGPQPRTPATRSAPGPAAAGPAAAGPAAPGPAAPGPAAPGLAAPGPARIGPAGFGPVVPDPVPVGAGPVPAGPVGPGPAGFDRPVSDRAVSDRAVSDRAVSPRPVADGPGTRPAGPERVMPRAWPDRPARGPAPEADAWMTGPRGGPARPVRAPGGPAFDAESTVPSMRPVPLGAPPAPVPRPSAAPPPQPAPHARPAPQPPRPRPAATAPPARRPWPGPAGPPAAPARSVAPLPLSRAAAGPVGGDQEPALVSVDGESPVTRTGALAVLALPPARELPRRRPAAPAPAAELPQAPFTPAVLQQAWSADLPTMQRLLAGLHRMN
jgi:hypothetical protein